MTIRAVIVDDEPLARRRLRQLLAEHTDVAISGESATAAAAAELCASAGPDVLFLDIEIPQGNGLELMRALSPPPAVIFTTAHPQFAVDAFDLSAVDYLVKPISPERLSRALHRLRRSLTRRAPAPPPRGRRRIAVRTRSETIFLAAAEIEWIAAEGNYSRIHTRGGSHLVRELIAVLEQRLEAGSFIRVHRSAIVNAERIRKIVVDPDGGHSLVLANGSSVRIGASYHQELEQLLGGEL